MSDVVNIGPKPSLLSPERECEIYESSMNAGRKIADVLVYGMSRIADAAAADQISEIAALKARVEKLEGVIERIERAIAPREVWTGE